MARPVVLSYVYIIMNLLRSKRAPCALCGGSFAEALRRNLRPGDAPCGPAPPGAGGDAKIRAKRLKNLILESARSTAPGTPTGAALVDIHTCWSRSAHVCGRTHGTRAPAGPRSQRTPWSQRPRGRRRLSRLGLAGAEHRRSSSCLLAAAVSPSLNLRMPYLHLLSAS